MKTVTVIDTSFGTWNLGDEIIMQAVNDVIHEMFPDARVFRLPSHEALSRRSYYFLRQSDMCFIGGTNVLASKGWRLRWFDSIFLTNAICFGVTWGGISTRPSFRDWILPPRRSSTAPREREASAPPARSASATAFAPP